MSERIPIPSGTVLVCFSDKTPAGYREMTEEESKYLPKMWKGEKWVVKI